MGRETSWPDEGWRRQRQGCGDDSAKGYGRHATFVMGMGNVVD